MAQTLGAIQVNDEQWLALDIEAGFAVIDQQNSAQHLPQQPTYKPYLMVLALKRLLYRSRNGCPCKIPWCK